MDLQKYFHSILSCCFEFDYRNYRQETKLKFAVIKLLKVKDNLDCICYAGDCDDKLIECIKKKGLGNLQAAYYNYNQKVNVFPTATDLLLVSEELLNESFLRKMCILFHEACHLIIEKNITHKYNLDTVSKRGIGKSIRDVFNITFNNLIDS